MSLSSAAFLALCVAGVHCSKSKKCGGPTLECGSQPNTLCVDPTVDVNNCGACGTACAAGQFCSNGTCGCPSATPNACGSGATGFCTNFQTDIANCGSCGKKCAPEERCASTGCVRACPTSTTACPTVAPTYCANLANDPNNCGGCGSACPIAGETCAAGACVCGYASVATARTFSCALKTDNSVVCWGLLNNAGGSSSLRRFSSDAFGSLSPFRIQGLSGVQQIAAADATLCALKTDGTVWCLGGNASGQLGANLATNVFSQPPVQVLQEVVLPDAGPGPGGAPLAGVTKISGHGQSTFCAIANAGAEIWCWGANGSRQGGAPTPTTTLYGAHKLTLPASTTFTQLASGHVDTCALDSTGFIWCWGTNGNGQTADAMAVGAQSPTPLKINAITGVAHIGAGRFHTCAQKTDGTLWCFGTNASGQLGTGATGGNTPVPVRVQIDATPTYLTNVDEVAAGDASTCARSAGKVWCWGDNSRGELANNLPDGGVSPTVLFAVQVPGIDSVISLAQHHWNTCAIRSDSTAWCWGRNARGQLGTGSAGDQQLPVRVAGCD